ncbi:MAG: hypothetical protein MZV64_12530 [Ignavibacteriales bacterium]|nr:hypothetical protein [Ignavibacteriales bacterium]
MDDGTEVLMSGNFRTTKDANGDTLVFPGGDRSAPPSGPAAQERLLLRHHHPPGAHRRGQARPRATTSRSSARSPRATLDHFEAREPPGRGHRPGRHRQLRRHRPRRHRPRPRPGPQAPQGHPGRRGVVRLDPDPPRLRPQGLRAPDRDRPRQPRQDPRPGRRPGPGRRSSAARTSAPSSRPSAPSPPSASSTCPTTGGSTTGSTRHTAWKTFKHSCGAVDPLIPAFIESGFDILNPVQVSAAGMDARAAQGGLRRGTSSSGAAASTPRRRWPSARRRRSGTRSSERCEIFGRDGGFVFNAIHNIQANVPIREHRRPCSKPCANRAASNGMKKAALSTSSPSPWSPPSAASSSASTRPSSPAPPAT